jgi:hypothetical protein
VEWLYLGQDTDGWRALVDAAMNLRFLAPLTWVSYELTMCCFLYFDIHLFGTCFK